MNTLQVNSKKAKSTTAPVKVDVEKVAVVQAIKDYIILNMTDEEGDALVAEDITAPDHYLWLYYKQVKDARKDLSGAALIAEVANQVDISGEETGVAVPVMVDKDAPQWVIDASADINKDAEVSAMTVQYIDSLEFTAHAAGNIFAKLHTDGLDFSNWAIPGTRSVGENTKDMAYCDAGKSYSLRGKTHVNKSNKRIAMDTYRNEKGEVRSAYVQLASRVGKGIEISRDRDDYAAGMITKTQKVPSGKYTQDGMEINPTDCANNYAKLSSLLTKFATALKAVKQTADNYEGINNELTHVKVKFRKDKVFNHATGKVDEKSTGRFVIFDKDDPTNMNVITHTDLMRYDVGVAKEHGGTIKALRESRPSKKKGANTSTNKPGQTEHTVQTTNIAWDTFTNYIRGIEDFYESNPSALVTKLREAKNADVALNIGKVTLEGLRAMLLSPDVFAKLFGDDVFSELETKFADVRKRMTKAA